MDSVKTMARLKKANTQNLCNSLRLSLVCALLVLLSACGGGGGDTPPVTTNVGLNENTLGDTEGDETVADETLNNPLTDNQDSVFPPEYQTPFGVAECSVEDINQRVDFDMRDYYIYYDQVPQLNLANYDSPEDLIKDLRVAPDEFSYVDDAEEQMQLVDTGGTRGFGFRLGYSPDEILRAREIRFGSPADDQGMLRGDEIMLVNGTAVAELTDAQIDFAFDPDNAPISLTIRTGDEAPRDVSVDYAEYVWQTAGPAFRFTADGLPTVGYLPIRQFLETTEAEIDQGLAFLTSDVGFDDLVVDLRYNPGGRTHVARHIASVVGGAAVANQVFLLRTWNDKYSALDEADFFDTVDEPLNLPRVFVLTTGRSASASEVFINALKPYIEVIVIGEATYGKPFTSNTREYCGKAINAMRSLRTNALGVSVAGGIQPDCPVEDEWKTTASDTADPLLRGALSLISENTCPTALIADATLRSNTVNNFEYGDPEIFVSEE